MTADRRPRRSLRGRRSILLALALLAATGTATAAPAPPRATSVTLTRSTTIAWTGFKGIRLVVPGDAWLPRYDARLFVRGGTYAFVRVAPTRKCMNGVPCWFGAIDYTTGYAKVFGNPEGPGTDHWARIDQEALHKGTVELYLFTDGAATMTFDSTRLGGAPNAVTAAGRVRAEEHDIPLACDTPNCTTAHGGMARSVGRGGGASYLLVENYDAGEIAPDTGYPNVHTQRACAYPAIYHNDIDADPAKHPDGCDRDDPDAPAQFANMSIAAAVSGEAYFLTDGNPSGFGLQYVGFQTVTAHRLAGTVVRARGLWFDYGIR